MKYRGKYSLKENLFRGRGMGLLSEGFKITPQFKQSVEDFLAATDNQGRGGSSEDMLSYLQPGGVNTNDAASWNNPNVTKSFGSFPLCDWATNAITASNIASGKIAFYACKASNSNTRTGSGVDAVQSSAVNGNAISLFLNKGVENGYMKGIGDLLDEAFPSGQGQIKLGCYAIDLRTGGAYGAQTNEGVIIEKHGPKTHSISKSSGEWQIQGEWVYEPRIAGRPSLEKMFGPATIVGEGGYEGRADLQMPAEEDKPGVKSARGDRQAAFPS